MTASATNDSIGRENPGLRDISAAQWKSGLAAWLGWLFDGLDMHLYMLVAAPFVADAAGACPTRTTRESAGTARGSRRRSCSAGRWAAASSAASATGWAAAGRSALTILTYALFTGLSSFAQTWWHLLIFRFLAALGIGGEWAVGASLLSETWPRRWRPWMAAVLQTAVNVGVLLASVAAFLLAGVNPAAGLPRRRAAGLAGPLDPPRGPRARRVARGRRDGRRTSACDRRPVPAPAPPDLDPGHPHLLAVADGALGLHVLVAAHLGSLPDLAGWSEARIGASWSAWRWLLVMVASIAGNFVAAWPGPPPGRSPDDRADVPGLLRRDGRDLRRPPRPRRPDGPAAGDRRLPGGCSPCSRCTCRRCSRRCSAPRAPASATISAASPRRSGPSPSACSRPCSDYRTALIAAGCLFLPAGLLALALPELDDGDEPRRVAFETRWTRPRSHESQSPLRPAARVDPGRRVGRMRRRQVPAGRRPRCPGIRRPPLRRDRSRR